MPPEFCSKLTYMYLLKAVHLPGDTWARVNFDLGHNLNKLSGRAPLDYATNQISRL